MTVGSLRAAHGGDIGGDGLGGDGLEPKNSDASATLVDQVCRRVAAAYANYFGGDGAWVADAAAAAKKTTTEPASAKGVGQRSSPTGGSDTAVDDVAVVTRRAASLAKISETFSAPEVRRNYSDTSVAWKHVYGGVVTRRKLEVAPSSAVGVVSLASTESSGDATATEVETETKTGDDRDGGDERNGRWRAIVYLPHTRYPHYRFYWSHRLGSLADLAAGPSGGPGGAPIETGNVKPPELWYSETSARQHTVAIMGVRYGRHVASHRTLAPRTNPDEPTVIESSYDWREVHAATLKVQRRTLVSIRETRVAAGADRAQDRANSFETRQRTLKKRYARDRAKQAAESVRRRQAKQKTRRERQQHVREQNARRREQKAMAVADTWTSGDAVTTMATTATETKDAALPEQTAVRMSTETAALLLTDDTKRSGESTEIACGGREMAPAVIATATIPRPTEEMSESALIAVINAANAAVSESTDPRLVALRDAHAKLGSGTTARAVATIAETAVAEAKVAGRIEAGGELKVLRRDAERLVALLPPPAERNGAERDAERKVAAIAARLVALLPPPAERNGADRDAERKVAAIGGSSSDSATSDDEEGVGGTGTDSDHDEQVDMGRRVPAYATQREIAKMRANIAVTGVSARSWTYSRHWMPHALAERVLVLAGPFFAAHEHLARRMPREPDSVVFSQTGQRASEAAMREKHPHGQQRSPHGRSSPAVGDGDRPSAKSTNGRGVTDASLARPRAAYDGGWCNGTYVRRSESDGKTWAVESRGRRPKLDLRHRAAADRFESALGETAEVAQMVRAKIAATSCGAASPRGPLRWLAGRLPRG